MEFIQVRGFVGACRVGLLTSVILNGCSAERSVPASGRAPLTEAVSSMGDLSPAHCAKASELVYLSNFAAPSKIEIFDGSKQSPKMCGAISYEPKYGRPYGLYVDAQENLWVADTSSFKILKFPKGASQPSLVLNDPDSAVPADVAVDDRTGTVYVSDFAEVGGSGGGIEVYESGQTQPVRFLQDSRVSEYSWIALDSKGNLYVVVLMGLNYSVFEWRGGKGKAQDLMLDIGEIGGIRVTSTGGLAVCTYNNGNHEQIWCGEVAPHSRTFAPYINSYGAVCFDKGEAHIFIPGSYAAEWAWPGPQQQYVNIFYPTTGGYGVAVSPPDPPGPPFKPN